MKYASVWIAMAAAFCMAGLAAAQEQVPAQPPATGAAEAPQVTPPPANPPAAQAPAQAEAPEAPAPAVQGSPATSNPPAASDPAMTAPPATDSPEPMGETTDAAAQPGGDSSLILPHDLSPWGMFINADIVVKAVMMGLAFASLVTWTVWLAKTLELFAARVRAQRAMSSIVRAGTLAEADAVLGKSSSPAALLVQAARQEVTLSERALDHVEGAGLKERVASRLSRIEAQASRRMTRGTGLLATIGSTAPFVGLFGTVWGIMNAFIGISEAQTTNLAVVAPGIAEALLATALGLVAAIPAVVIYNVFARAIAGYKQVLADAAAGVERLVSRDLDYRAVPARALAAE
jgi:biopolymer transport protein ExbB